MLGDIAAILGGPSKRRRANEGDNNHISTTSDREELDSRKDYDRKGKSRETRHGEDDAKSKNRRRTLDGHSDSRDGHRRSSRREERHRDRRSSSHEEPEDRHRRRRDRSPQENENHRRHHRRSDKDEVHKPAPSSSKDKDSDSDPLEDIIGPAPPSKSTVHRRGRGHNAAMSGIDSRFAADYDPTVDVTPDPDDTGGDDWDNAVEAFRDRQKWKKQGAERLRSAGFTEDQIQKWEKGDQKDESDVQWNKAGGVREWDRGKVIDGDDGISPDLEFGRLKGT
jgi:hypothetical protein